MELPKMDEWAQKVFSITNAQEFNSIALAVYHFQYANNSIYQNYCKAVFRTPDTVMKVSQIPFLPISFFKTHKVVTTSFKPQHIFKSSGTTGMIASSHFIKNVDLYEKSFTFCFEQFFGPVPNYCILALLPSYLEKGDSSLIYMVQQLITKSGHPQSGFYLYDLDSLHKNVVELEKKEEKTILIGVTYALMDFATQYPMHLKNTLVMETGGMKGRKKEIIRNQLYEELMKGFQTKKICSEYGMTELLSQAYAVNGIFQTPPWMQILIRDETDPLSIIDKLSITGAINVIDLANIYSCSFIATDDIGRLSPAGGFEIMGRMDNSDIRGCSLMAL